MSESKRRTPTRWAVWCIIGSYATLLVLAAFGVSMPLDGATWALTLVVGAYVGVDELSVYIASRNLPRGEKYTGSYAKLRNMVIAMFALTLIAVAVETDLFRTVVPGGGMPGGNEVFGGEPAGPNVPIDRLFVSLGIVVALFAGGNKAANVAEQTEPTSPAAVVDVETDAPEEDEDELDQR